MRIYQILPWIPFLQRPVRTYFVKKSLLFPALLSIELTNHCNASCIMCPRGKMTREKTHMEFSLFKKIVNDSKNFPLKTINLFWFGESLVYPGFLDALIYIKKNLPGAKVHVSTNAGLLNRTLSEKIVQESLVSTINIDLDGVRKETAEKIRPGTDFKKVVNNVETLLDIKRAHKKSSPEVRMTIIRMEENRGEVQEFFSYWKNRVNRVDINSYNTWTGNVNGTPSAKVTKETAFDFPCEHPWNELVVAADGRASLCCLDFDCKAEVGDVRKETLKEIWNGERLDFHRKKLMELDYTDTVCERCNAYVFQKKSLWRAIWI